VTANYLSLAFDIALDVEAAQSPLNYNNLAVFQPFTYNGKRINVDQKGPN
jgi:hypothetical protein